MNGVERSRGIQKVLIRVLVWNLLLSAGKIILGISTGLLNVLADGIHSIGDSASNLVGLAANKYAGKTEDDRYPYGYGKFETVGALFIVCLIVCGTAKIAWDACAKLFSASEPVSVNMFTLAFIGVSIVCNLFISRWEKRKGLQLKSDVLTSDAAETRSDVWVSASVFAGLLLMKLGVLPSTSRIDACVALVVVVFLCYLIKEAAEEPIAILCDAQAEDPDKIRQIAMAVSGVMFCQAIRSHGPKAAYFLNLDIGVSPDLTIEYAHDVICHNVKVALRDNLPYLKYACIHIEPDTPAARVRKNSAFRGRDSYGHSTG
ncbi:MAG: cation diffusion facilitator family transporter [Candidatus Liptonbacteria bacterium]|nr:cation diffusion facilitator family transporter [Candidatus Liptonbacteria bacterium]